MEENQQSDEIIVIDEIAGNEEMNEESKIDESLN